MRRVGLIPLLLVLAACGGSSKRDPSRAAGNAGTVGDSGGSSQAESGASSGPTAGGASDGGSASTVAGESGLAGAAEVGGAAGCIELECLGGLGGLDFIYAPSRKWKAGSNPNGELREADYEPFESPKHVVHFADDARSVELTPLEGGGSTLHGQRDLLGDAGSAWFTLEDSFSGGRFVVKVGGPTLQAEYTLFGSGVPVASSTRGPLLPAL